MSEKNQYGKAIVLGLIVSAIVLGLALYFVYSNQKDNLPSGTKHTQTEVTKSEDGHSSVIPDLPKADKTPEGLDEAGIKELDDAINSVDSSSISDDLSDLDL